MNVKRFTARTSRDALALVRQAFGDDAVVMSTRPCAEGVEVLAMAPESVQQLERIGAAAAAAPPRPAAARAAQAGRAAERQEPSLEPQIDPAVQQDLEQLQMSTLSFQDYVRQRMLKRREAQRAAEASVEPARPAPAVVAPIEAARARHAATQREPAGAAAVRDSTLLSSGRDMSLFAAGLPVPPESREVPTLADSRDLPRETPGPVPRREVPVLREEVRLPDFAAAPAVPASTAAQTALAARDDQIEMMTELRSMRGLIEQRFGALAFMEKLQRQPRQAQLAQRLLDTGFSPALIRKLVESLPADVDEQAWAAGVLERNLVTGERESPLEEIGGIYALIGATGVGKTTSTAKLAAAFATRHGATNLGLITLDAYRVAAHEQLRTYGRILGVPVHTAHDRASLEDLLDLLSGKRMVLIDTAGMAQRDSRTGELLEMLSHRSISRLLVVNASAQGETIEDQLSAYAAPGCRGLILSKLDEAVKLGPALDSMIRHKLRVLAVANGQRVPEDWHRLSAHALVQRALKGGGGPAWRLDSGDMNLIFAGLPAAAPAAASVAAPA
jgi:flagellar biosynthesis protein FlhF